MSKKKALLRPCRIFQWIEAQDSDFAGAIRDLCLEGSLSPGGRHKGITFLYPKDKAYRGEIVDKAYSNDADEAEKMIKALIVPDALTTGGEFSRRPVGNLLGVKFAVETVEDRKVKIAGGLELELASDFRPLTRRAEDIAVWIVTKGRAPLEGEAYKAPAATRGKAGGAARGKAGGAPSRREDLAAAVEGEFDRCMRLDRCRTHHPYLAKVVSLLNYLKAKNPALLASLMPILDYDPAVSFYLLLEPFKTTGGRLISDDVLFGDDGWNCADAYGNAVDEYKAFFAALPQMQAAAADQRGAAAVPYVFRDRAAAMAAVDARRQQIAGDSSGVRRAPQVVQDTYTALMTTNTINGLGPILPDSTRAALAGQQKLWQDEFRFILHEALQAVRAAPAYESQAFAGLVRDIRESWPGNDYGAELRLANAESLKSNVSPRDTLLMLMKFVNSTDFLYLPAAPAVVGGAWGSPTDMADTQVYNRNAVALASLGRIQGMVRSAGVSPQTLQELQIYAQTHGSLPPQVLALVGNVQ